jgi:hypothetical protein
MSTEAEKLQAIRHATESARKRMNTLQVLKEVSKITKAQEYELDMCKECVKRGDALLKGTK